MKKIVLGIVLAISSYVYGQNTPSPQEMWAKMQEMDKKIQALEKANDEKDAEIKRLKDRLDKEICPNIYALIQIKESHDKDIIGIQENLCTLGEHQNFLLKKILMLEQIQKTVQNILHDVDKTFKSILVPLRRHEESLTKIMQMLKRKRLLD